MAIRLVQLNHPDYGRRVALVQEPRLLLLDRFRDTLTLIQFAVESALPVSQVVRNENACETLDYNAVYAGDTDWELLLPVEHPDPAHCLVSGTGLTHLGSAESRQEMHQAAAEDCLTDSMRMFLSGVEGGRPEAGKVGVQPEWFYKGSGAILKAHGSSLLVPPFAWDAGEEAEVAGVYWIAADGTPLRIGFCNANEFSDHRMEAFNYLYLAPSKLRECSIGPELAVDWDFRSVQGTVKIEREGELFWTAGLRSGEQNMSHSLPNLEHHHFKYPQHRIPGDLHIHFFGADQLSCRQAIELKSGDVMEVSWQGLGRPLRNSISLSEASERLVTVQNLG